MPVVPLQQRLEAQVVAEGVPDRVLEVSEWTVKREWAIVLLRNEYPVTAFPNGNARPAHRTPRSRLSETRIMSPHIHRIPEAGCCSLPLTHKERFPMSKNLRPALWALLLVMISLGNSAEAQEPTRAVMHNRYRRFWDYVVGGSLKPHWLADGSSFWFAAGAPENTVIYRVDPEANVVDPLFDIERVRAAVVQELGHEPPGDGLPFEEFRFVDEGKRLIEFKVDDRRSSALFHLDLDSYSVTRRAEPQERDDSSEQQDRKPEESPDGRWLAAKEGYNIWLRSKEDDREVQITEDGEEYVGWQVESWSPNSSYLILAKSDRRLWERSPQVTWLQSKLDVRWRLWPKAGTPYSPEFHLFDVETSELTPIEVGDGSSQKLKAFGWTARGAEFFFGRVSHWYQRLELLALDPRTRSVRVVITETSNTFLSTPFPTVPNWRTMLTWLEDRERFVWTSERDGWRHLYLYRTDGTLVRRLSRGDWPVFQWGEIHVSDDWVYFWGHSDPRRPYDLHYLRVKLDGTRLTQITEAPGQHQVVPSPSREFLLDTHSSMNRLPTVELRRSDGTLVRILSRAELRNAEELSWSPPEEFVVKAADGNTDLYGVLFKPWNLDPAKRYPVVESIYQGPQTRYVFRGLGPSGSWRSDNAYNAQALAQLGFIVVMVDGRGTPERGKAFRDAVYENFGRFEIDEHAAVLEQLAAERPYMDLSRVGIYGASWGGYYATRALLIAPELYKVGVALVPAHPTGLIHEPYLGPPDENGDLYEYAKNENHLDRLEGNLLFITGTSDGWYSDLMRLLEAFVRAEKPYDLLVLPERGHNLGGGVPGDPAPEYTWNALVRYFQEHLQP